MQARMQQAYTGCTSMMQEMNEWKELPAQKSLHWHLPGQKGAAFLQKIFAIFLTLAVKAAIC